MNGDEMGLMHPVGVQRVGSRTIVVADVDGGRLLFFDTLGTRRGPTSNDSSYAFKHIAWIGTCGTDSLFVWDMMKQTMSVLDEAGKVRRDFRPASVAAALLAPTATACSQRGLFAQQSPPSRFDSRLVKPPLRRGEEPIILMDVQGNRTVALPSIRTGVFVQIGGGAAPQPLGPSTSFAFAGDQLYVGTADSNAIDVFSLKGVRIATIPTKYSRIISSERNRRAAINDIVSAVAPAATAVVARGLDAVPFEPAPLPPYRIIESDGDHLWVVVSGAGDNTKMEVLGGNGTCIGTVELPLPVTPQSIDAAHLFGTYIDEREVVHIVMFRVHWRQSAKSGC